MLHFLLYITYARFKMRILRRRISISNRPQKNVDLLREKNMSGKLSCGAGASHVPRRRRCGATRWNVRPSVCSSAGRGLLARLLARGRRRSARARPKSLARPEDGKTEEGRRPRMRARVCSLSLSPPLESSTSHPPAEHLWRRAEERGGGGGFGTFVCRAKALFSSLSLHRSLSLWVAAASPASQLASISEARED